MFIIQELRSHDGTLCLSKMETKVSQWVNYSSSGHKKGLKFGIVGVVIQYTEVISSVFGTFYRH